MSSASAPLSAPLAARAGRTGRLAGSPTLRFIIRRLLAAIPVLFGVTFLSFVVMNSLPGDAAQELLGASATPSEIHQLGVKLGLDKPFLTRYWDWLHQAVIGHLGHSLSSGQSVGSILGARPAGDVRAGGVRVPDLAGAGGADRAAVRAQAERHR